ncbi:CopD family protein [Sphingobium sp. CCH11-B1]|jgi:putative membrane protein|uniref:CopD family protein n=1 Tax=Sphingobium sp. CCH11-B1 TaxID=1768781 RepID=UPI000832E6F7|nr:CopD family protein [Sphingobium sp. CCH11-B1]MEA3389246.1 CopD family protein [Pseudomonadota bacterium]
MPYLGAAYLWVKAAHVIFVIFLMAGLFMMPRFFVYHQETAPGSPEDRKWVERETRLLKIILNPSLTLVWIFGLMLMVEIGAWNFGWFHLKLLFVLGLSAYHGWIAGYAKKLDKGQRPLSDRQLRMMNEIPGIAAAIIVVAVIVKPF